MSAVQYSALYVYHEVHSASPGCQLLTGSEPALVCVNRISRIIVRLHIHIISTQVISLHPFAFLMYFCTLSRTQCLSGRLQREVSTLSLPVVCCA